MSVPSLSPVAAPQVVCPNCKNLLDPEITQSARKGPVEVKYFCVNEKTNCSWVMVLSVNHVNGEYTQLKEEDLEKRREQAKAEAEMRETHEGKVRRLIMLLPHMETILQQLGDGAPAAEQLPPAPEGKAETAAV